MKSLPLAGLVLAALVSAAAAGRVEAFEARGSYAVVVSRATATDAQWQPVVAALRAKYDARVIAYDAEVSDALPALREAFPRYTCFVARPAEATRQFVADVHRMTRRLDDDPYADTFWGILTGYDAGDALRVAQQSEPLVVRKVAAGTEVALEACEAGVWYCELNPGKVVRKDKGGPAREQHGPTDSTAALVAALNDYKADLFVTSGHATERDWQIGYRYRNGSFRHADGKLFGVDTTGKRTAVDSPNPKVYLAVGNCLMGHIDRPDCMALSWMHSAGVNQMVGYTVLTWYGYAGWGCLDYFVEQPGRYTLNEAFFANNHALMHRLNTYFPTIAREEPTPGETVRTRPPVDERAKADGVTPQDAAGLLHDRDVLAFYGDPAWPARMADGPRAYEQTLTRDGDVYTLEIKPLKGAKSFDPVNTNGAQRGWRPIIAFLPQRIGQAEVLEGQDLRPVVADDFVLVPNPRTCEEGRTYLVKFRARPR